MGLFSKILDKLGFDKPEEETAAPEKPTTRVSPSAAAAARIERLERINALRQERESKQIPLVDVTAKLEKMAAEKGMELNWKVSIADLLFLLDIDHSYEARKELAVELGCPEEFMSESAKMNTWLHKTVLEKLAENGGDIPMELLD